MDTEWRAGDGHQWPPSLPVPLTALVGREHDLAEVTRLVADNRLVTLVGCGGVGKTRLAIEAAAAVAPRFADGLVLVDLSEAAGQALVWSLVARAAGVEERADGDLAQRVAGVLGPRSLLVVLDNCEHLLAVCGSVATRLLGCCPRLRILTTSREGLGVPGEVTWRVPSLAFPWPDHPLSLDQLGGFGAMALFAERARAARPGFEITAADITALSSICFRLDGIPLALELAAARVSALSIREIADRLDDRFTLLTRPFGGLARHQTLRASLDWSCQLLSQPERALFGQLAVFSGGWSLRAAESVCAGQSGGPDHVARLLAALVDKSLVQAEDTVTGTRYRLLEAVKPFAHEQLVASGESADIRARHGRYFADLSEQAAPRLYGPDQAYWASCLDQEQANLRVARRWCAADPARAGLGLAMAAGLGQYWLIRGKIEEGDDWLREALERASGPSGARATALGWLAVVTSLRGGFQRAGELFEASIALYGQAGDCDGQARFLAILGFWRANQGDPQGAAKALEDALALSRQSHDRYIPAFVLMMASVSASITADIAVARASAARSTELFTEIGDRLGAGYARTVLADCLTREGDPREGLAILRACVGDFEAMTDRWGLLLSAGSAALAHAALGDWARTAVAAGVADGLSERIGGRTASGIQAAVAAAAAKANAELGPAAIPLREAGRAAGRGDQIAAALGLEPGTGPARPQPEPLLTRREQEITQLIAAGLTNRQIAERLFIALRTVDTHVVHILAKLGCSNRAQVAALTSARKSAVPDT